MKKRLFLIPLFLVCLISLFFVYRQRTGVHYIDTEQLTTLTSPQQKGTQFIVIGRKSCPHCQKYLPFLKKAAKKQWQRVYYYDTDQLQPAEKQALIKKISQWGVQSVPTLLKFEQGTVKKKLAGENINQETTELLKKK